MRVLVGGLGFRFLRDDALGPWVADRLASRAGGAVEVEDVSYHAVGLSQNLQERGPYDRFVLVGTARRGRPPGTLEVYRWERALPPPAEIQERVAEAATGLMSLDGHLIVCAALGGLPDDVRVVEVEPGAEGWGEEFSAEVAERLDDVLEAAWTSATR